MRLTLRTLLAYLDDVLEPNEAREIGQKLSQSKEATELVTQIREAIRRRRIGAPELAGPGSGPDPNIVSEYLENVLEPNQVIEFEKLCRTSELHLAEVAACHKILTMVMGQPIDVADELRERMYVLGATKAAETVPQEPYSSSTPQMTSGMGTAANGTAFGEGLPDYLKKSKGTGRIWSSLLVVLIAGVWVALVVLDDSIWTKNPQLRLAQNDQMNEVVEEKKTETVPVPSQPATAKATANRTVATGSTNKGKQNGGKQAVSINPPPPADDQVLASALPKPNVATTLGNNPPVVQEEMLSGEKPAQVAAVPKTNEAEKPKPAVKKMVAAKRPLTVLPPSEVNLILPHGAEMWQTTRSGDLGFGDTFAVPEPFSGELNFQDDLSIQVLGGSRIQRQSVEGEVSLRIRLERGRLLIMRPQTSIHPTQVEIEIGNHVWQVDFAETGTELAVAATLPQPEGRLFQDKPAPPQGGMATIAGKLSVKLAGEESVALERSSGWIAFSPKTGELLIDEPLPVPIWTNPDEVIMTPARSQLVKAYEKEFQTNVLQSIAPVVADRRAIIAEFAVKTMAITENYLEIVPALNSDHQEARLAAIVELREWIAEDPENMDLLSEEMERLFRSEVVENLVKLLWGYSKVDAQSTEISQMLVELLANESLAIRELAFFHASRLSGRNYGYHPQAPKAEINAAIGRWVEFVKRDKSLVQPE